MSHNYVLRLLGHVCRHGTNCIVMICLPGNTREIGSLEDRDYRISILYLHNALAMQIYIFGHLESFHSDNQLSILDVGRTPRGILLLDSSVIQHFAWYTWQICDTVRSQQLYHNARRTTDLSVNDVQLSEQLHHIRITKDTNFFFV